MSCGSVDASTLPLTWKLRTPLPSSETAIDEFIPSPYVQERRALVNVGDLAAVRDEQRGTGATLAAADHRDDEPPQARAPMRATRGSARVGGGAATPA